MISLRYSSESIVALYNITNIVGDLELAVCASSLGMNDTLGNSLTVKVCQQIDQVEIL